LLKRFGGGICLEAVAIAAMADGNIHSSGSLNQYPLRPKQIGKSPQRKYLSTVLFNVAIAHKTKAEPTFNFAKETQPSLRLCDQECGTFSTSKT